MNPNVPIVTIDGPSSSGKGTISRIVAARVGWHLLDSGALYRLVALGGIQRDLDPDDVEEHVAVARAMKVEFGPRPRRGRSAYVLDGRDVTHRIRTEAAGAGASRVAAWPAVRAALTGAPAGLRPSRPGWWRRAGYGHRHLPGARLKVFLTAATAENGPKGAISS